MNTETPDLFRITGIAGVLLGEYHARNAEDALNMLAVEIGYDDWQKVVADNRPDNAPDHWNPVTYVDETLSDAPPPRRGRKAEAPFDVDLPQDDDAPPAPSTGKRGRKGKGSIGLDPLIAGPQEGRQEAQAPAKAGKGGRGRKAAPEPSLPAGKGKRKPARELPPAEAAAIEAYERARLADDGQLAAEPAKPAGAEAMAEAEKTLAEAASGEGVPAFVKGSKRKAKAADE